MANYSVSLDLIFHALADPTRRAVVQRLCRGAASVGELAEPFDMKLPTFMQHLKVLEGSGLVRSRKKGRVRTCELQTGALDPVESWVGEQRKLWEQRFDRLDAFLKDGEDGDGEIDDDDSNSNSSSSRK
ncbi:ArsR/SmtB family transcription factor [Kiloniella sp. b19]|uniref:ArsR/SmtB family transcription factor n=1 Tax=Kiloniella sp. GXU_MW_B19 TaxID=3141326 RepID=UPI0031CEEE41